MLSDNKRIKVLLNNKNGMRRKMGDLKLSDSSISRLILILFYCASPLEMRVTH